MRQRLLLLPLLFALSIPPHAIAAASFDADSASALAKKANCYKCHAIDKRKKAPSYKDIAKRYAGKPNAEREVFLHITGNPVVKLDEGEEKHIAPETRNEQELYNLVRWILSQ